MMGGLISKDEKRVHSGQIEVLRQVWSKEITYFREGWQSRLEDRVYAVEQGEMSLKRAVWTGPEGPQMPRHRWQKLEKLQTQSMARLRPTDLTAVYRGDRSGRGGVWRHSRQCQSFNPHKDPISVVTWGNWGSISKVTQLRSVGSRVQILEFMRNDWTGESHEGLRNSRNKYLGLTVLE